MSVEKTIREHFGWSQEQLALYLGVSRSLVKRAEAGERSLPIDSTLKLSHLQLFMLGKDAAGKPLTKTVSATPPTETDGKQLLRQASRYEALVEKTTQQLADMQQRYQQAQNNMALFRQWQSTVFAATNEEGKKDKLWLELIEATALKELRRNGPEAQAMLQWRIDCYTYAAQRAKELGESV